MADKFERVYEKRLGQILLEKGIITSQDLEKALGIQTEKGGFLGEILLNMGVINPNDVEKALFLQFGAGFRFVVLPPDRTIDLDLVSLVPRETAEKYCLIPFSKYQNVLTVVISNPIGREEIFDQLKNITGLDIQFFIGTTAQIKAAIKYCYGLLERGER